MYGHHSTVLQSITEEVLLSNALQFSTIQIGASFHEVLYSVGRPFNQIMDASLRIDELLDLMHGPAVRWTDVVGDVVHLVAIILSLVVVDSTIGVGLCHDRLAGVALGSSGPLHLKELIAGVNSGESGLDFRDTIGSERVSHVFNGGRVATVIGIEEEL